MRTPAEYLLAVNRSSIPLGNGGRYHGEKAVFHPRVTRPGSNVSNVGSRMRGLTLPAIRNVSDKPFVWATTAIDLASAQKKLCEAYRYTIPCVSCLIALDRSGDYEDLACKH